MTARERGLWKLGAVGGAEGSNPAAGRRSRGAVVQRVRRQLGEAETALPLLQSSAAVSGRGHNRGVAHPTLEPRLLGAGLRRKGGAALPPGVVYGI